MSKTGYNQFKRAVRDNRGGSLTDARNPSTLPFIDEPQSTTIVEDELNKKTYIQILPNRRQDDTDRVQLKSFPGYRLLESTVPTTEPPTTSIPDDGLVDSNLNEDVTAFLRLLNEVGARISYFMDAENSNNFTTTQNQVGRDIVGNDKMNIDSVSSNIIRGVNELKAFFYEFGKKIAPHGVNPYCNDDCMELKKKKPACYNCGQVNCQCATQSACGCGQTVCRCKRDQSKKCEIEYAKAPYNPADINTYLNCLDAIAKNSIVRDPTDGYNDFNLKVFQTIITRVKTTKFDDDQIIDELNVVRPQPYYNPLLMMLEVLKIDTKLFNILYLLNLHNSVRSPITGAYYGKQRTKINEHGYPVLSDTVTNTDIHNATLQTIDLISCILKLITFVDIDSYNKIIEEHFSILSVGQVTPADGQNVIIGTTALTNSNPLSTITNDENIPCFLYGLLMSFCDAARQAISEIPLENFPNSPLYNPSKVATITYNCTFGLMAISQMMEELLKSRCFATIMAILFPSGSFHSAPESSSAREFGPRFTYPRLNDKDMQSITRFAIDGVPLDMTKVIPSSSIPNYIPDNPITINKALFCTIITALCGISRFLWNSNSPCLRLCDLNDDGAFDPDVIWEAPDGSTTNPTTEEPCNRAVDTVSNVNINVPPSNRAVRELGNREKHRNVDLNKKYKKFNQKSSRSAQSARCTVGCNGSVVPPEHDNQPDAEDFFSIQPMIQFLQENTYASVVTENNKILTFFQIYVCAFAEYERTTFNSRVSATRTFARQAPTNRNLYNMLTRGMEF
jgi:hypothetical protein